MALRPGASTVYFDASQLVWTMRSRNGVEDGLSQLGAQAGVPLGLDQDGCCAIVLDDGLNVVVEADEARGLAHLHADLLRVGRARRLELFERAMALNLFCAGTEGATLGLDGGSDALVLYLGRPLDGLTGNDLAGLVGEFVGLARRLRDELQQSDADTPELEAEILDHARARDFRFIA